MTAISTSVSEMSAMRAPRTRLRLTPRGRRVLAVLASLPVVCALAFGVVFGGEAFASREDGAPAGTFETVTVMPGDSLWTIAQKVAPAADPRDAVDAIAGLNQLGEGALRPGQELSIPAAYSD